jgi:hypothetical protein
MIELQQVLTEKTQDLKELFVEKSVEYAGKEFDTLNEKESWSYNKWLEVYPQKYSAGHCRTGITLSKLGHKVRDMVYMAHRIGRELWIWKAREAAIKHYNLSIVKLAYRLEQKGIGINFQISATRLKVNFEMTISDKDSCKVVRAWTIVASGPVQKPHYRYLVK